MTPLLKSGNTLSIMLSADGFCCCEASGGKIRRLMRRSFDPGQALDNLRKTLDADVPVGVDVSVSVVWDAERMCLLPDSFNEPAEAAAYLQTKGFTPSETERIVISQPVGGIVALMCAERDICDYLEHRFDEVSYLHPLQTIPAPEPGVACIEVVLTSRLIHLSASADRLLYAESLPGRTEADLLYYLHQTQQLYPGTRFRIRLSGIGAEDICQTASSYFRHIAPVRPYAPGGITRSEATAFATIIRMCYANH